MRTHAKYIFILMTSLTIVCFVQAGPLEPVNPPAPTMKTLTQVEPRTIINATNTPGDIDNSFIINEPGSYYLVTPLIGEVAKNGILIDANDVVIDLNGFAMTGVPGSGEGFDVQGQYTNLVIQNGSVNHWGSSGIRFIRETILALSFVNRLTLRNLHVSENAVNGIYAYQSANITDCLVTDNGNYGIIASTGANVRGCTVLRNQSTGISLGQHALISDCVASNNGDRGIIVSGGAVIVNCVAIENDGEGISASLTDALVRQCTANDNGADGITVGNNSSVIECTVKNNDDNGIQANQNCLILNNNCSFNTVLPGADSAGVLVVSSGNRIEGNNCVDNDRGIEVLGSGNIILKNTASGNGTNYAIPASNAFGPLVNVSGVGDISGTLNADHPWANFEY